MNIRIDNDILDDEFVIINLEDFEDDDLNILVKMFSKGIFQDNVEAAAKIKEYAENCGIKLKGVTQ